MKSETLKDLQRIAIAKHGEDHAWSLAYRNGNPRHKQPWREAINTPVRTPEEVLEHQMWCKKVKESLGIRSNENT